MKKPVSK